MKAFRKFGERIAAENEEERQRVNAEHRGHSYQSVFDRFEQRMDELAWKGTNERGYGLPCWFTVTTVVFMIALIALQLAG